MSTDSRYHRFWECPVFQPERSQCPPAFLELLPTLPPILTDHGWAVLPDTWALWHPCLLQIDLQPIETTIAPSPAVDQWIDVFTDGSCLWPRNKSLRLASWAVVQAHSNGDPCSSQVVVAGAVPGLLQSAHRAKLLAVLQSLRYAKFWGQAIRIWSDCEAVVSRFVRSLHSVSLPKSIHLMLICGMTCMQSFRNGTSRSCKSPR